MLNVLVVPVLPILLIFGLYHLSTWFNLLHINRRSFWRRVALVSVASHTLLLTGFFVFSWFDYSASRQFGAMDSGYGSFLFERSEFWRLLMVFDTVPFAVILAIVSLLDRFNLPVPGLLPVTIGMTYVFGSIQWYWMGGGIGLLLERFWSGLKGSGDEEWF